MSTLNELAEQISRLFPLEDTRYGIRYRIVDQLGGTTELEAVTLANRAMSPLRRCRINDAGVIKLKSQMTCRLPYLMPA